MELKDKIQKLRQENKMTQEELGMKIFVSRTAISKWETGKGYPSIASLQSISELFNISINELLSCEELMKVTNKEKKVLSSFYTTLIFFFLDVLVLSFIFIPLFGNQVDDGFISVNLLQYESSIAMKSIYYVLFIGQGVLGFLILGVNHWYSSKNRIALITSLAYQGLALLLFIASSQPYVGSFLLLFLAIKIIVYIKMVKMK